MINTTMYIMWSYDAHKSHNTWYFDVNIYRFTPSLLYKQLLAHQTITTGEHSHTEMPNVRSNQSHWSRYFVTSVLHFQRTVLYKVLALVYQVNPTSASRVFYPFGLFPLDALVPPSFCLPSSNIPILLASVASRIYVVEATCFVYICLAPILFGFLSLAEYQKAPRPYVT